MKENAVLFNEFQIEKPKSLTIERITSLWAFSEATFGGILHALSIPLRGAFLNAASVLFISLIGLFSKQSKEILKATLIVILIKALVSPHSPLAAYLAVSIQGLLGFILFYNKKFFRTSALLLGVFTLLFSGIQKIIVLTILFGNTLWKSLNIFTQGLIKEFSFIGLPKELDYSLILVITYISIHLLIGILTGIYAGMLPEKIIFYSQSLNEIQLNYADDKIPKKSKKSKKKIWILRPSGILIIIISVTALLFTYYSSYYNVSRYEIIIMIIRAILLTIIWYALIAPIVKNIFQKLLEKNKSKHHAEINEMINLFPHFRKIVSYCWKESQTFKGIKRIQFFLSRSFYYLLLSN
ncbi:MAG: hypothetical protein ACUVRG_00060 [Ignavibacterium sp.]|uniref:hypothetical protein n=1 Tax=Ignavibacterium sp. TaxID=2651167 RepID=UPI00404BA2D1